MVLVGASVLPQACPSGLSMNMSGRHEWCGLDPLEGPLGLEKQLVKWEGTLSPGVCSGFWSPNLLWDLSKSFPLSGLQFSMGDTSCLDS